MPENMGTLVKGTVQGDLVVIDRTEINDVANLLRQMVSLPDMPDDAKAVLMGHVAALECIGSGGTNPPMPPDC